MHRVVNATRDWSVGAAGWNNRFALIARAAIRELVCASSICLLVATAGGCATVIKGSNQQIPISSEPSGAEVFVDGAPVGSTPTTHEMKRKIDHLVTIQKPGYQPKSVAVVRDVGGAVWGNILAGGLIGWGVDAETGAEYNLAPKTIDAHLDPIDAVATVKTGDASVFVGKLQALDAMKASKEITDQEYATGRLELFREYMPEALPPEQRIPHKSADSPPPASG